MKIQELLLHAEQHWNDASVLVDIGIELESRSRLPESRRILERAIGLSPQGFPEAYAALAFAHFRDVQSTDEKGELALIQGLEATDSDLLKAWYIAFLDDAPTRDYFIEYLSEQNNPLVHIILGHALLWQGMHEESYAVLQDAFSALGPDYLEDLPKELQVYCSSLVWLQGIMPSLQSDVISLPILHALQQKYPNVYSHYATEITALQVAKKWNEVIEACKKTLAVFPDEETTMLAMALANDKCGESTIALEWLEKAIAAKPSFARARMVAARILQSLKKHAEAEELMLQIPTANPHYALGFLHVAIFLYDKGEVNRALELYRHGYANLKPYEKAQMDAHPTIQKLAEEQKKTILLNVLN